MEEAVRAAVRFAAERAAETEREDVREIERLLAAFAPGGVAAEALAARRLCAQYSVTLRWIPARVLDLRRIDDAWRGPLVRPLAARADRRVGRCSGRIDAAVIGAASRDSVRHFAAWADIGDENELFQNFKYLWHFVAAYGEAAEAPPEISPFKKHPQVL